MNRESDIPHRRARARFRTVVAGAMTLVEVLLMLVLGTLLVTVAARVTVHSVRVRDELEASMDRRWTTLQVKERFRADVQNRLSNLPVELPVIRIPSGRDQLLEVITLVDAGDPTTRMPRRLPARVTYRRGNSDRRDGMVRLLRGVRPLVQSDVPASEETLIDGLRVLELDEFRGARWRAAEPADVSDSRPGMTALRLRFSPDDASGPAEVCTVSLPDGAVDAQKRKPR